MIESGYIYIVDGASFVLFKYFFRGRQIALVLGGLQLHLSRTPWRVLRAFSHQLADSRGPEALGPQGLPDLQVAPEHHFQAEAFQLGRAGHGCVRAVGGETGLCLCFSRLRFRIWAVMELQR